MEPVKLEVITAMEEMEVPVVGVGPDLMAQVTEAGEETVSSLVIMVMEATADEVGAVVRPDGTDAVEKVALEDMVPSSATMVMEGTEVVADVVVMAVGMVVMAAMVEMEDTVTSGVITATAETGDLEAEVETAGTEPAVAVDMVGMVPSLETMQMAAMAVVVVMAVLDPMAAATEAMVVTAMLRATTLTAGTVEPEETVVAK